MVDREKKTIIYCEKGTKELYDEIKNSNYFRELDYAIIFGLSAAYGFSANKCKDLAKLHSGGLIRTEYVINNTDLNRMFEAIAIAHKNSLEVLLDKVEIYEIAERYANGGIRILHSLIFNNMNGPDFDKEIENEINEAIKKIKK